MGRPGFILSYSALTVLDLERLTIRMCGSDDRTVTNILVNAAVSAHSLARFMTHSLSITFPKSILCAGNQVSSLLGFWEIRLLFMSLSSGCRGQE